MVLPASPKTKAPHVASDSQDDGDRSRALDAAKWLEVTNAIGFAN